MPSRSDKNRNLSEFGEFSLDAYSRTLRKNGEIVTLPPLVLDTLLLLVERRGEVLTKREMLDAIWPETFVEEGNLTQNIYILRRTLGRDQDGKDWIETMPRRGYVFSGKLNVVADREENPSGDGSKRPTPKRFGVYIAAAAALIVGVFALGFLAYSSITSRGNVDYADREVGLKKLTFSGDIDFAAISPDGKSFAFSRNGRLFVQLVGAENAREIALPEKYQAGFLQFLPDSRSIAFRSQLRFYLAGDAYRIPFDGGKPELIANNVWGGIGFSADGKFLSFVRDLPNENRHRLIVKDLSVGSERILAELTDPSRFIFVGSPAWSPDGKRIAIAVNKQEAQSRHVQLSVYNAENGNVEEFAPPRLKQFEQAVWMPDGRNISVLGRENQKFFQVWELSYPEGRIRHVTNDLNSYRGLSMSADGRVMLSSNYTTFSHIWTAPSESLSSQKQTTFGNLNRDGTIGMQWLPDGSIVYTSRIVGNVDIWRAGPGELDKIQLTRESGDVNSNPELSSDGKTLYFTSNRTGSTQIWTTDPLTGGGQTQITFGEKESSEFPQASPDGKLLYFVRKANGKTAIWRRDLISGHDEPMAIDGTLVPETFLALSPDGSLLATCSLSDKTDENAETQIFKIAIVSTSGHAKPRLFDIPNPWVTWSPDGKSFDFVESKDGNSTVWRQGLDGSPPMKLLELNSEYIARLQWTPDGKTLAISKGKRQNDVVLITNR